MHFKDGTTLTDKQIWPHQLSEGQFQELTSVERVVKGWHLSVLKSDLIKNFFIMTEAYQDMILKPGRQGPPPKIALQALGCYLKDSDPPVKLVLAMDALERVILEAAWMKSFRPDGFSKLLHKSKSGKPLKRAVSKPLFLRDDEGAVQGEFQWAIINEPPIRRVYATPDGLGCLIAVNKNLRVKAEIRMVGKSCHLQISPE
ncbi:MAG: hypothetical protein KAX31_00685 [Thermoplasmata archaeon]|nr:hypothetical protein [Thermoplasmata archaeon]